MHPPDRNKPLSLTGAATPPEFANGTGLMHYSQPGFGETSNDPPGLTAAPTVTALYQAFRRRWMLAVSLGVAGALLGVLVAWFFVPPKYTASARLRVARPNIPIFMAKNEGEADAVVWRLNQIAIIKSPQVLGTALNSPAVKKLGIQSESTDWLEIALKIDNTLGPEVLRLTLSGDSAAEVATLLNAIVDAYIQDVDQQEKGRRDAILEQLLKNQAVFEQLKQAKQAELNRRETVLGIEPLDQVKFRYGVATTYAAEVGKELRLMSSDLTRKEFELEGLIQREKTIDKEPVSKARVDLKLRESPLLKPTFEQIALVEKHILEYLIHGREEENNPSVVGLREKKDKLFKSIEGTVKEVLPSIEAEIRLDDHQALQKGISDLRTSILTLQSQLPTQRVIVESAEKEVRRLDPKNQPRPLDVDKLRNEVSQAEEALKKIQSEVANLRVEPTAAGRIVRILNAEEPRDRDYVKHLRIAVAAALGMFCLMLGGVTFWECRSRRVNGGEELVKGLGMSLIGTLPTLPLSARVQGKGPPNEKDLYWQSLMTESMDAIRTLLLHGARQDTLQVVMVTSAVGGEGKTSLASQLATSLARAWRKTLLIDGDLRNPAAHKLFDMNLEPGLSEVLRGETPLDDAIRATPLGRLWFLPAGHWDTHAVQALAQDGVKAIFDNLKQQYDFIIVDSCPILPVADSLLLGQYVDGVVMSVLRDVSRLPSVYAANQRMQALGIRTLGAVVIGGNDETLTYGYAPGRATAAAR